MHKVFDEIWLRCKLQADTNINNFSIRFLDKFHFNFWFAKQWPSEKIRNALAINLCSEQRPEGWNIYALTTSEFGISSYVNNFSRDRHGRLNLAGAENLYAFYDSLNHIFRAYDFISKRAVIIHPENQVFSEWEQHSPFREFWHLWALHNNALLIHSGIVCEDGKAVLLPGAGGSGKSTTVLSCLQNGMQTTGDDYNLLFDVGDGFCSVPLYSNIKTKNSGHANFNFKVMSEWKSEVVSYAEKTIYYPPVNSKIWNMSNPKLVGILCPNISEGAAGVGNIKTTALINKLAVSSIMQSPFMADKYLSKATEFTKKMKTANLNLSINPNDNAACIRAWLKENSCV